jgi:predicted SAM-dependent methyltransferase
MLKLNLGCGPVQPAGWVNVDGSRRAWLASRLPLLDRALVRCRLLPATEFTAATTFADLTRPLPWDAGVASAVYLGELLEHLTRDEARRLLGECRRVLAPGGIIRVRVPDGARFWAQYLRAYEAVRQRPRRAWDDAHTRWVEMFFRDVCVRPRLLTSAAHYHKWQWDEVSLTLALEAAGFADVTRRGLHDSAIPDVARVETRDDLIVEARNP